MTTCETSELDLKTTPFKAGFLGFINSNPDGNGANEDYQKQVSLKPRKIANSSGVLCEWKACLGYSPKRGDTGLD
jgi:hypothetical protein